LAHLGSTTVTPFTATTFLTYPEEQPASLAGAIPEVYGLGASPIDKVRNAWSELREIPELERLGVKMPWPAQTITVNGQEVDIGAQGQRDVMRLATPLLQSALTHLTSQKWYTRLPDEERRRMILRVRNELLSNAREQVLAPITGTEPPQAFTGSRCLSS
jgi:hypothetical protein